MSVAASRLSPNDQRTHRLFGVDRCLRVRQVEPNDGGQVTDQD